MAAPEATVHVPPEEFPVLFQLRDEAGWCMWKAEVDAPGQLLVPSRKDLRLSVTTAIGTPLFRDHVSAVPVDWTVEFAQG